MRARTHDPLIPSPTPCQLSHDELCFVVLLNHKFIYSKYLLLRMIIKIINIIAFDYNNLKNTIIVLRIVLLLLTNTRVLTLTTLYLGTVLTMVLEYLSTRVL